MSDPKITPPTDEEPLVPPAKDEKPEKGGRRSAWMAHVKKTMRANKGKPLSAVLKMAKKTYKKGGASITPLPLAGGKRRSRSRSRRAH